MVPATSSPTVVFRSARREIPICSFGQFVRAKAPKAGHQGSFCEKFGTLANCRRPDTSRGIVMAVREAHLVSYPAAGWKTKEPMNTPDNEREDFDRRLKDARQRRAGTGHENRQSAFGQAFRLSSEMVAGVLVGGFIGWTLDKWLGTSPWFLLVFFFFGVAAGILNAVRAAKEMNAKAMDE